MTEEIGKHNKEKDSIAGHVFLVGAGPGRRDLITVAGLELLRRCDTVVYDRLCGEELLAEVREDCERIYVGKQAGRHSLRQEEINRLLIRKAGEGRQVVRLKGGDPFVFGRGGEEAESLLAAHIPFSLVPGVTSAVAVPELAGIPVTHRQMSRSFHVITAHTAQPAAEREAWLRRQTESLRDAEGTLVFLMGLSELETICRLLQEAGRAPQLPAAVIGSGARYNEITVRGTLADIGAKVRQAQVVSPAMILVGETAALSLRGTDRLPLEGIRVGLCGTRSFMQKLGRGLREAGAETLPVQELLIRDAAGAEPGSAGIEHLADFTWAVFTSANGAACFFRRLLERRMDVRSLARLRIAVIGSGTAGAFTERGIYPDLMPEAYTAEHLAAELLNRLERGKDRVLLWQAQEGNPVLEHTLKKAGIDTVRADAYRIIAGECCSREEMTTLSYLVFASGSGVTAFCREDPHIFETEWMKKIKICAIGPHTARALRAAGCGDCLTAQAFTVQGLVETVIADRLSGR